MKKFVWRIEYSLTLIVCFTILLFLIPISFSSKNAEFISKWNDTYNKIDYMFTAMGAQSESDIVKGFKNTKTNDEQERLMMLLVKPYLRLQAQEKLSKKYKPHFMNGKQVGKDNFWYFDKFYIAKSGVIVGIKDILNSDIIEPAFMLLVDMNGIKAPNVWGQDIYGVDIYIDGKVRPFGYGWDIEKLKKDCSPSGTGISCSHYYRIGGEFRE